MKCRILLWAVVWMAANGVSEDVLRFDHIVADRTKREVVVRAAATGVGYRDPIEFVLLNELSGHDYEAVAVTRAKASDVLTALQFIGMVPGEGVNYLQYRFWPKGERVRVKIRWNTKDGRREEYAENVLWHVYNESTLPVQGFTFTGSFWVETTNETFLAADRYGPYSIISTYNCAGTLLDMPGRASQDTQYGAVGMNREFPFEAEQTLDFVLTPEYPEGRVRVREWTWRVSPGEDKDDQGLTGLKLELIDEAGHLVNERNSIANCLGAFNELSEAGQTPYITLDFSPDLTIAAMRAFCEMAQSIEGDEGIRIEPPPEGQLYYKSFLPHPDWRTVDGRYTQPPELHIEHGEQGEKIYLRHIKETWPASGLTPTREITIHPLPSREAFVPMVTNLRGDSQVLLIYAPADTAHQRILSYAFQVRDILPTVYVFIE